MCLPVSLNPAACPVAGLEDDHSVSGLLQQVAGSEAGDARTNNDHFLPVVPIPTGKPVPEEVEEDVGSFLVWVAVSVKIFLFFIMFVFRDL